MSRNKYMDLGKNVLLFSISSFGTKMLSFFLMPLYTSYLSTRDYGTADLISTTISLLLPIFTLDISDAVLRFTIGNDTDNDEVLDVGVKILFIGGVFLIPILGIVFYFKIIDIAGNYFIFFLVSYFLNAVYLLFQNYLRGTNQVTIIVKSGLLCSLVTCVLNIIFLAVFQWGVNGYLLAICSGIFVSALYIISSTSILRGVIRKSTNKILLCNMIRYSAPLMLGGLSWWINNSLDKYFITVICGVAVNGIYSVAYKIPSILNILASIFNQAWTFSAVKEFDKNDTDGFFGKTYSLYNFCMVFTCSVLITLNVWIADLLFSKEFFYAWKYTGPLLLSSVFGALNLFCGGIFAAVKETKITAYTVLAGALVNIVLNVLFIPRFGAFGAGIATLLSTYTIWAVRMVFIRNYVKMKINIIRDIFSYCLLTLQFLFNMVQPGSSIVQAVLMLILIILYASQVKEVLKRGYMILQRFIIDKKRR